MPISPSSLAVQMSSVMIRLSNGGGRGDATQPKRETRVRDNGMTFGGKPAILLGLSATKVD